jgi:hypothetical protein
MDYYGSFGSITTSLLHYHYIIATYYYGTITTYSSHLAITRGMYYVVMDP